MRTFAFTHHHKLAELKDLRELVTHAVRRERRKHLSIYDRHNKITVHTRVDFRHPQTNHKILKDIKLGIEIPSMSSLQQAEWIRTWDDYLDLVSGGQTCTVPL